MEALIKLLSLPIMSISVAAVLIVLWVMIQPTQILDRLFNIVKIQNFFAQRSGLFNEMAYKWLGGCMFCFCCIWGLFYSIIVICLLNQLIDFSLLESILFVLFNNAVACVIAVTVLSKVFKYE